MATCVLFSRQLDTESCLSLLVDAGGNIEMPLAARTPADIRTMQVNAKTIVVVPTDKATLLNVQLPWLTDRKARAAIPFAVEDQLAQAVTTVHFAFDRAHYKDNQYLVVALDKQFLGDLITKLHKLGLAYDVITLDWFALNPNQACFIKDSLLINDATFKGALALELHALYLKNSTEVELLAFSDSNSDLVPPSLNRIEAPAEIWIAQNLTNKTPINLAQSEFQKDSKKNSVTKWYYACASLLLLWGVSLVTINVLESRALGKKISQLDSNIAVIYREFFPNAPYVISPKFRIEQLLKNSHGDQDMALWTLMNKLAATWESIPLTIQQLRFQNDTLSVTLTTRDFATLEKFEMDLQRQKVKVAQTQASTQETQVVATLELSL